MVFHQEFPKRELSIETWARTLIVFAKMSKPSSATGGQKVRSFSARSSATRPPESLSKKIVSERSSAN